MPLTQHPTPHTSSSQPPSTQRRHLARKQKYPNSCGAAVLLCAAMELGVRKMPLFSGSLSSQKGVDTLELNSRCESDLYMITSNSLEKKPGSSSLRKAGYSMPDNMVLAGRLLGLSIRVEKDQSLLAMALQALYSRIEVELTAMGCPVVPPLHALRFNELRLEALATSVAGIPIRLHWVLHRPDGSYMNPGTGENYLDFSALEKGVKRAANRAVGYYRSGISIVVSFDA